MAIDVLSQQPKARDLLLETDPPARWYEPLSSREILFASTSLALLAVLLFLPHLLHGGLYLDDWGDAALALQPPEGVSFTSVLSDFDALLASCRPVQIVLIPLKYLIFGTHTKYLLALSVGLAFLAAAMMYGVLRTLGLRWYHAWSISALTLAYPWFDSTRFWESANLITLAAVLAFAGLWLALLGLSHHSWRMHACAALLYLLSMLTYEVTLPFIALAGLIYTFRDGWPAARLRWGIDLVMVAIAGAWSYSHTPRTVSGTSGGVEHLRDIVAQGGDVVARSLYPLGSQPHTSGILVGLAIIFALGACLYFLPLRKPHGSILSRELRVWLLLGLGGLALASLGWLVFVPADPYYTPTIFGVSNRVNGFAGFGVVLAIYAAFGVVGSLVAQLMGRRSWAAPLITLALALLLGATYLHVLERHSRLWREAYEREIIGIEKIRGAFPRLPHRTTIFAGHYPANVTLGVPIFTATWDLDGMVKLTYDDDTLQAFPITEELPLECLATGMRVGGPEGGVAPAPYGSARLIDLESSKTAAPGDRRECLEMRPEYPPGPLYLSTAY